MGHDTNEALFLGAALAATSVGITARVLSDLRALATVEARTVLGAAVADDVLGLVILTVVVRIVSEGTVSIGTVLGILGVAIAVPRPRVGPRGEVRARGSSGSSTGTRGRRARSSPSRWRSRSRSPSSPTPRSWRRSSGRSSPASRCRAAPRRSKIQRELAPIGHLFIPVFFLQIGIEVDVGSLVSPEVLAIGGALLVVAIIGKLVAGLRRRARAGRQAR